MRLLSTMAAQALWFLLAPAVAFPFTVPLPPLVAAASSDSGIAPPPVASAPRPGCPSTCGNVSIPYPFGIGGDCAWRGLGSDTSSGFNITCNHSFNPPRPYTGDFEIMSISLEAGEMRVYSPVSYSCYNSSNTTAPSRERIVELYTKPLFISRSRNVFTGIGCATLALLAGREDLSYFSGCYTSCVSLQASAQDGDECAGLGCCQMSIPRNLSTIIVNLPLPNNASGFSPCQYAFIAEKGGYNFTREDLTRDVNTNFTDRVANITMVLDWAIRDGGSCRAPPNDGGAASAKSTAAACISTNSFCVNATQGSGYLCNCSQGYMGNPYIPDGCRNINECMLRKSNPAVFEKLYHCDSNSKCHDTDGDYECKCKFGHKGDGKSDKGCEPIVPVYATALVALIVAAMLSVLATYLYQTRQQRKRFNKNGGKILEVHGITIYTKSELEIMTKKYSKPIGEGHFGKVYKGTIKNAQGQPVAVKRSEGRSVAHRWQVFRHDEVQQNEQEDDGFVNEITFQFKIRHANVVQLLGCCLETDIPILVFEFVPNGSLENLLHGVNKTCTLSLLKRLDIAIGSAEALSHMHSQGDCIRVHGDVKPANILLDKDLKPKVSDFGSSKLLKIDSYASFVAADRSYVDPVYYKSGRFTVKSDVYSFGLVLLELITRKTAKYDGNQSLSMDFVKCCKHEGNGRKMYDMDMFLSEDAQSQHYMECLDRMGALAVRCLKLEDVEERPTMAEVVDELKQAKLVAFGNSSSEAN